MAIKFGDSPFLSLSLFFEWTCSSEASLWMDAFSSSSLSEPFVKDQASSFSSFLVSLAIFSYCNLMYASFSSLSLTSLSSMAFMATIFSSKFFVLISMIGMTTDLEDLASFFN